ncbi:MAG: hypothetical protein V1755_05760 [Chloroflexota bacterium]
MNIKAGVKTTEFWLGLAAVLIGAFLASGVLPSDHWAIKVCGILAVALASLGYSISRGQAKSGGPPVASLLLPLLLVVGLSGGCAMSAAQRLQLVAEGTYQLKEVAAPAWSSACEAKAKVCVAEGVQASKDCKPWATCQAGLKRFYEAHMATQRAIQQAAWYLLNDKAELAQKVLATAQAGLAAAFELARAEGAIQ